MIKIVCDKDDKESAEKIVKLVQKYQICPPFVDCSPAASCDKCIAEWLEIEVINGMTELERLKEQVEHEQLKEQEAQRDYEQSVEYAQYCEEYEPTYNPEDGSM